MPTTQPSQERWSLALAAVAVLLTRLPWIGGDYGSDPDGYRVIISARHILRDGVYRASRLPGYPAYEFLSALTVAGPAWVSNLLTAILSVAAFLLFALILRELRVRRYVLQSLGFAMVPVIYVNSCCTMDYIPSLAAILAASYAVLRARPVVAGQMLGLAIGCRITAGAMVLPLALWMLLTLAPRQAIANIARFGITTLLTGVLCFLPVYRVYGLGFFSFVDNDGYPPSDVVFGRAIPLLWGQIGAIALLLAVCAVPVYYRYSQRALQSPLTRHALGISVLAVLLYTVAFMRFPNESGYLVPLVPWVIVIIAVLTPPVVATAVAVMLLVSPWIGFDGARPTLQGAIVEDHLVRVSQRRQTPVVIEAVKRLPGRATIVSGWVLPRIELALDGNRLGEHQFIYLIDDDHDYARYVAEGRQIYFLPGVDLYESQVHQLELAQMGARRLDVPHERQRPKSAGE